MILDKIKPAIMAEGEMFVAREGETIHAEIWIRISEIANLSNNDCVECGFAIGNLFLTREEAAARILSEIGDGKCKSRMTGEWLADLVKWWRRCKGRETLRPR